MTIKVEKIPRYNQRKVGFSEISDLRQKSRLKSVGRPAHTRLTSDGRADRFCEKNVDFASLREMFKIPHLWVDFSLCGSVFRILCVNHGEISDDFKIICGLMVWVGIFPYRYCTKENPKANT